MLLKPLQKTVMESLLAGNPNGLQAKNSKCKHFQVYTDAYVWRLTEVLMSDFPGLLEIVGEDLFKKIASEYAQLKPGTHYNVRYFGAGFTEFLQQHELYSQHRIWQEMALFEWSLFEVSERVETESLSVHDLSNIPAEQWSELTFDIHPAVSTISLTTNVPEIWQAIISEAEILPAFENLDTESTWLIWRQELEVYFRMLDDAEAYFMQALAQGSKFAQLCQAMTSFVPEDEAANTAAAIMNDCLVDGLLVRN